MKRALLALFPLFVAINAHAVTDEFLNARADRAAERAAAASQNPARQAQIKVTIRKLTGIDDEEVCSETLAISVIDDTLSGVANRPARLVCKSTVDNRPVAVVVSTDVRLTSKQMASLFTGEKVRRKLVVATMNVIRPEEVSDDMDSAIDPVREDLYQTNMIYVDTANKNLVVPVGLSALTKVDMNAENFTAIVELIDSNAR